MLMTIENVATYLNVSKETVYKMAQKNRIPAIKVGSQWRFNQETIDQWIDDNSNKVFDSKEPSFKK